jgi:hypothetical protein
MSSILKAVSVSKAPGITHPMTQHHNTENLHVQKKRILRSNENAFLYDAGIFCCSE